MTLLDKLSSYNLFNNFLPGILFVILLSYFTEYEIIQDNLLHSAFLYYFIGMTISRVSSLVIEPILIKSQFVKFKGYKLFAKAYRKDAKLDILVETSNKFRVLLTVILLVICLKIFYSVNISCFKLSVNIQQYLLLFCILVIYLFAYRKQTNYITKRIDTNT